MCYFDEGPYPSNEGVSPGQVQGSTTTTLFLRDGPETRGIARSPIAGHSLHGHEATKHVVPTAASPIAPLIITTCTRAPRAREHKTDQPLTTNEAETRTAAAALPPPKLLYQPRNRDETEEPEIGNLDFGTNQAGGRPYRGRSEHPAGGNAFNANPSGRPTDGRGNPDLRLRETPFDQGLLDRHPDGDGAQGYDARNLNPDPDHNDGLGGEPSSGNLDRYSGRRDLSRGNSSGNPERWPDRQRGRRDLEGEVERNRGTGGRPEQPSPNRSMDRGSGRDDPGRRGFEGRYDNHRIPINKWPIKFSGDQKVMSVEDILFDNMKDWYRPHFAFMRPENLTVEMLSDLCHELDKSVYRTYAPRPRPYQVNCMEEEGAYAYPPDEEPYGEEVNALSRSRPRRFARPEQGEPNQNAPETENNIICWNCRQFGHFWKGCQRNIKLFCHVCGRGDVSTANCPENHPRMENQKNPFLEGN
ncbi:hypothetical protein pipiens_004958 [Culex pipiens pipiens]|uniref:CCHC-type domain-containing protein n=1 Tax=Culex pipiens pipiens TaxID=38569 RepID=A0ABD1CCY1_CULPP